MNAAIALKKAKQYTEESLEGSGAVKGKDGFSPTIKENSENNDSIYKLDITDVDGSVTTPNLKGSQGIQGIRGEQGERGPQGEPGTPGDKGEKGDDGYPFLIYKEYSELSEFNADDFPEIGLLFMIKQDGTDYPVYRFTGEDVGYSLVTTLKSSGEGIKGQKGDPGEKGEKGDPGLDGHDGTTYSPIIGNVEKGDTPSANVRLDEDTKTAIFDFVLPSGDKGEKGDPGLDGQDGQDGQNGLDGNDGKDGKTYTPQIGTIDVGSSPTASVDIDEDNSTASFNFTLPETTLVFEDVQIDWETEYGVIDNG